MHISRLLSYLYFTIKDIPIKSSIHGKIKAINFIGDKIYNDIILRNIILSEETKFWKFLTKNKFLDMNRIKADINRLESFYKNRGYFNVKIKSTSAIIT